MERAFIIGKESKYYRMLNIYEQYMDERNKVVNDFFNKKGIESIEYHMGGNGRCNAPFYHWEKEEIYLYIIPTDNDLTNFKTSFNKPLQNGLRKLRKNSELLKEFQQICIDKHIIINPTEPDLRDYFQSLRHKGYYQTRFIKDNNLYLLVKSDYLDGKEIPKNFIEIKLSEFYRAKESLEV